MSSRLFEEVREKRGLAYEIRSGGSFHRDAGSLTVTAGVDTQKVSATVNVILNELRKLCRKPVLEEELRRAKDYYQGQLSLALEDTLEHMLWAGERVIDRGEIPDREKITREVEAVTVRDIRKVAQRLFRTNNLSFALIGPVNAKAQKRIKRDFEI